MKARYLAIIFLVLFAVPIMTHTPTYYAKAADGSNGYLDIGINTIMDGQPLTIRCYNLDATSDYTLDFTSGCADQVNFTTADNQDEFIHITAIQKPTGATCTITIESQSDGTALDTVMVTFYELDDVLPTNPLITIGIAVLLVAIVVSVVVGVRRGRG